MKDRVELDETLAIGMLAPMMEFTEMLNSGADIGKARIMMTLIDDMQEQLEDIFNQINKVNPNIRVARPYRI